ncbi:MAG: HEAT repeat domain-containing protein [bacterium]|nr:MAG: HEAT repeat domain-containing protein [bacterium]
MSIKARKQALAQALQDQEEMVRAAASRALDRVEGLERLDEIGRTAREGDIPLRIRAIHFLGYLNTSEAVESMLAFLQDPNPDIRVSTIKAIQTKTPDRALIPLFACLDDPDASVVQVAIETLSYYRDPRATEFIIPYLTGSNAETACVAAEALGRNGDPSAEPHLIRVLNESDDPFLRSKAAEALGNLNPNSPETSDP